MAISYKLYKNIHVQPKIHKLVKLLNDGLIPSIILFFQTILLIGLILNNSFNNGAFVNSKVGLTYWDLFCL